MRKIIEIDKYLTTVFERVGLVDKLNTSINNTIIIGELEVRKISRLFEIEYATMFNFLKMFHDYSLNNCDDKVEEIKQFFEENVEKYLKKRDLFTKLNEAAVQIHKSRVSSATYISINEDQITEISNYLNISYGDTVNTLRDCFEGCNVGKYEILKEFFENKIERKISSFYICKPNLNIGNENTLVYDVNIMPEQNLDYISVEFKIYNNGK